MTYIFEEDKAIGDIGEQKVIDFIKSKTYKMYFTPNKIKFPYYDIYVVDGKDNKHRIEVKTDTKSNDDVAIECMCKGQYSGISISTANVYCAYKTDTDKLYWIHTDKLKKYIDDSLIAPKLMCEGTTYCYLIDLKIFNEI